MRACAAIWSAAGFETTVTTRTRAKAEALLADGATWADTPEDVAARSDVVFTMLGYPDDVRSVLLGHDGARASSTRPPTAPSWST